MAAKELAFDVEARAKLLAGVEKLAAAVKATLGPRGRNAVIDKSWGGPTVTKDGVTVADEIDLTDRAENLGAKLVKQAASKTSKIAGDGTTTATVLTEALFKEAYKNLTAGADAMALKRGMEAAAKAVVEKLASLAKPVDIAKANDIINVASDLGQQRPRDRQDHGRGVSAGRQGRRHHRRGRQELRDRPSSSSRACSSTAGTCRRTS